MELYEPLHAVNKQCLSKTGFARERKYLCERMQKFGQVMQSFSGERKGFAKECIMFEKQNSSHTVFFHNILPIFILNIFRPG